MRNLRGRLERLEARVGDSALGQNPTRQEWRQLRARILAALADFSAVREQVRRQMDFYEPLIFRPDARPPRPGSQLDWMVQATKVALDGFPEARAAVDRAFGYAPGTIC